MTAQPASLLRLPIGRRVGYWRQQRKMTQQVLADLIGKSKSWVDKVERGVLVLDKYSVVCDLADVLQIDQMLLLCGETGGNGGHRQRRPTANRAPLHLLREALAAADGVLRAEQVDARIRRKVVAAVVRQYRSIDQTRIRHTNRLGSLDDQHHSASC